MMEMLIKQLKDIHAQNKQPLHEVTVLAARAALVVAEKYYRLALECDVYEISLGELCLLLQSSTSSNYAYYVVF